MKPTVKKRPRTFNQIGHVRFPVHSPEYENLAEVSPSDAGVMTVRLLVEDQTADRRWPIAGGPDPTQDDFLVGCDQMAVSDAYAYFKEPHRIVENLLCGVIDWSGVKRLQQIEGQNTPPDAVEFFRCTTAFLDEDARRTYEEMRTKYEGCKLFLLTSLDRKPETVTKLMDECEALGFAVQQIAKVPVEPIICWACEQKNEIVIKPLISAKRLGWKKIGHKGRKWLCPMHAAEDKAARDLQ